LFLADEITQRFNEVLFIEFFFRQIEVKDDILVTNGIYRRQSIPLRYDSMTLRNLCFYELKCFLNLTELRFS
jgi:hypothetical protein